MKLQQDICLVNLVVTTIMLVASRDEYAEIYTVNVIHYETYIDSLQFASNLKESSSIVFLRISVRFRVGHDIDRLTWVMMGSC